MKRGLPRPPSYPPTTTTTYHMEPIIDLQNTLQNQASPPGNAPPVTVTSTPRPPQAASNPIDDAGILKEQRHAELSALRSGIVFLIFYPSLTLYYIHSKQFGHIPGVPIFTQWKLR